jgi:hypothetical protein
MVFCASTWSFQKSGAAARDSRRVSSSSRRAASKIAPQIRSALAEILVTAHQFVHGRHAAAPGRFSDGLSRRLEQYEGHEDLLFENNCS